jgi:hypothetical protein
MSALPPKADTGTGRITFDVVTRAASRCLLAVYRAYDDGRYGCTAILRALPHCILGLRSKRDYVVPSPRGGIPSLRVHYGKLPWKEDYDAAIATSVRQSD